MSGDVDLRVAFWVVWGVGTVLVYGALFARRYRIFRKHQEPRARRDLMEAFGLFLVSVAAALGITAALFGPTGQGWGRLMFAVSSGVFFVVGLYSVMEREPIDGGHAARRQ
jgi:hypothetical protein